MMRFMYVMFLSFFGLNSFAYAIDTTQYYDGEGVDVLLYDVDENFIDCTLLEDDDCIALNINGCSRSGWPQEIAFVFDLTSYISCDGSNQRKIWFSTDPQCDDSNYVNDDYWIDPITFFTTGDTQYLCNQTQDYYPDSRLDDPVITTDVIYEQVASDVCSGGGYEEDVYLCYAIGEPDGDNTLWGWHRFRVDTLAPDALGDSDYTVLPSDNKIVVKWESDDDDIVGVRIRIRDGGSMQAAGLDPEDVSTSCKDWPENLYEYQEITTQDDSYSIKSLVNDNQYQLCLIPYDELGNEGPSTAVIIESPRAECGFWECTPDNIEGGFCFIATAAYGTTDPAVHVLRQFRDVWLLSNRFGRQVTELYYRVSPPLARCIADKPILQFMTRVWLTPIVEIAEFFLWVAS